MTEKQNIKVIVRTRPQSNDKNKSCIKINKENNEICINHQEKGKTFAFDNVLDMDCTQQSIFQAIGKPITDKCISGYNATIFAYGQTGSGKTYTMQGLMSNIFQYLFETIKQKESQNDHEFEIKASVLEIYMEKVTDLLTQQKDLKIRENTKNGEFIVPNLSEKKCISAKIVKIY